MTSQVSTSSSSDTSFLDGHQYSCWWRSRKVVTQARDAWRNPCSPLAFPDWIVGTNARQVSNYDSNFRDGSWCCVGHESELTWTYDQLNLESTPQTRLDTLATAMTDIFAAGSEHPVSKAETSSCFRTRDDGCRQNVGPHHRGGL